MDDTIYIGYDVINTLGVMSYIYGYDVIKSSCDAMHTEYVVIYIIHVMSYRVGVV